jgi:hypothetical protein
MGVFTDSINAVYDLLEADSKEGQLLEEIKHVWFGEDDAVTTLTRPFLWVHLDDPATDEAWTAAQDIRGTPFRVLVEVVVKAEGKNRPYGVTNSKRGMLELLERVMNRLEAQRATLLGSNGKNVDMQVTLRRSSNIGDSSLAGIIIVTFLQRFSAGGR